MRLMIGDRYCRLNPHLPREIDLDDFSAYAPTFLVVDAGWLVLLLHWHNHCQIPPTFHTLLIKQPPPKRTNTVLFPMCYTHPAGFLN
jgi:hypothetical protein